jgi:hypothetical protein
MTTCEKCGYANPDGALSCWCGLPLAGPAVEGAGRKLSSPAGAALTPLVAQERSSPLLQVLFGVALTPLGAVGGALLFGGASLGSTSGSTHSGGGNQDLNLIFNVAVGVGSTLFSGFGVLLGALLGGAAGFVAGLVVVVHALRK